MKCIVKDVVGEDAITTEDGQSIYERIHPELTNDRDVELDFDGVAVFASLFFNAAIGQLLKDLSPVVLNEHLALENHIPEGRKSLDQVIKNAKEYYASDNYREAQIKVLKDLSEES